MENFILTFFQTFLKPYIQKLPWANTEEGKIGYAILWLLGVPLPILILIYLIRGH